MKPLVSVVIPMHNEASNAGETLARVAVVLRERGWEYELIPVNDGSDDDTGEILGTLATADPHIRPVSYQRNRGRGYALRSGFAAAEGRLVASLDADLSYSPDHAVRMFDILLRDEDTDVVVGSPYMPGGSTVGVPPLRLAISRGGNVILRHSLSQPIYTSTGVLRAYRIEVLRSLDLESDDKEIHLEILSKVLALGFRVVEMPATLATRKKGKSHFRLSRLSGTMGSHLEFSVLERPAALFGLGAAGLVLLAVIIGVYLLSSYFAGGLNPERPLMTVMVVLLLGGEIGLGFAMVAALLLQMRKDHLRMQRDILELRRLTEERPEGLGGRRAG